MYEMSTGRTFITVLVSLAVAIALGGLVFMIGSSLSIEPMHTGLLIGTYASSCIFGLIAFRLAIIKEDYYESRFSFDLTGGGVLTVRYLQNEPIALSQLVAFVIRPLKYIKTGTFNVEYGQIVDLCGTLEVSDKRLYLGGYYLGNHVELYQYIGDTIELRVRTNRRGMIEKDLAEFDMQSVRIVE